jgi:hypothetical protein
VDLWKIVLMADGSRRPIKDVARETSCWASDPETGRTEARRVLATIVGGGIKRLVEVTVDIDGPTGEQTAAPLVARPRPSPPPMATRSGSMIRVSSSRIREIFDSYQAISATSATQGSQ